MAHIRRARIEVVSTFRTSACNAHSAGFAAMAKWTRRWKPIWVPCCSNFQKACVPIPHDPHPYRNQMEFQENGRMCAGSSSHPVPRLSGIFACTVRSKVIMKFLESNLPTRVATTRYGFIFCMSTHGWLIAHLEMGIIGGQSSERPHVESRGHPRKKITWPSA